jgi:hypothetical protein
MGDPEVTAWEDVVVSFGLLYLAVYLTHQCVRVEMDP